MPTTIKKSMASHWGSRHVMTWTFVESAFRDTVTCAFEGPQMRFARSVNVNSSALDMPTLMGKVA